MLSLLMIPVFLASSVTPLVRVASTAAPVNCDTNQPCALFGNSSSGPALSAAASAANGIYGVTRSGNDLYPGIEAESFNVSGSDAAAAFGLNYLTENVPPTYGALGYGSLNGLYGETANSGASESYAAGVFGQDDAVSSNPDDNAGVLGASSVGTGVLAESVGTPINKYFGSAPTGLYAFGPRNSGIFVVGDSVPLLAINPASGFSVTVGGPSMIDAEAVQADGTRDYFSVDNGGNGYFTGTVSASRGPDLKTTGASGTSRITYGSRSASPEIEDVGRTRLTAGRAYVALDAALGDSIDMRRPYHVFVTPEGDCRGLFVTQKSARGFLVQELRGGRSSLTFDYRIVAKPFDDDRRRLATAVPHRSQVTGPLGPAHDGIGRPNPLAARFRQRVEPIASALQADAVIPASKTVTCAVAKPCAIFDNSSTGLALEATSLNGPGLLSATASGNFMFPGIEGESGMQNGKDAAAGFGLEYEMGSYAPTYGALAYGVLNGLYGATESNGASESSYAAGVFGQDVSSAGGSDNTDYNAGVLGASGAGTGVLAESNGTPSGSGPFGTVPIGTYAVADYSSSKVAAGTAYGAVAESDQMPFAYSDSSNNLYGGQIGGGVLIYLVYGGQPFAAPHAFMVDLSADAFFSGVLSMDVAPNLRTTGASGNARIAYGSREASPQIEDFGTARMTGGAAYVALDPALADSIDMREPYQVFVTADGDSKDLYVTQETPAGFAVRESGGGRSTLSFDYRIVGKPVDDKGARLALAPPGPAWKLHPAIRGRANVGAPLSPEARLKKRLGAFGYARVRALKGVSL